MAFKVFVSNDISEKGIALLKEKFDVDVSPNLKDEELLKVIDKYDAIVTRSQMRFTKEIINAASKLKVIGRAGVGVDNIDVPAATAKGVMVINAPEGNTLAATEHTIAMIMAMTRHIPQAHQSLQEGKWDRKSFDGIQVAGKTLGIIGVGRIGSRVALRMQAMEMTTIGYDPYITKERGKQLNVELVDTLDELLRRSDYITIHTPLTDETRNMICAETIAKMKDGVRIANIARGGCMDHQAVADAIKAGKVAGCCCDVYKEEPLVNNPFKGLPQVVQTPHLGASTLEAQVNVAVDVAYGVIDALEGRPVMSAVNMAPISKAVAETIQPYFALAERMGNIAMGIAEGAIKEIEIEYTGDLAVTDTGLLTIAALKGLLTPVLGSSVNFVNASDLAKKRNINVKDVKSNVQGYYSTLIKLHLQTEKGEHRVYGTLFDGKTAKIVDIDTYRVDFIPKGNLILAPHIDKPNMIGQIATLLGKAGININGMQVGSTPKADTNIMAIAVGKEIWVDILKQIRAIDGIIDVKMIQCEE
ncbi:MAG: phosphoglycerate dehydrogenase [Phascolarctobacterium sp.]|nr:phosphoglycerate dehydrogenase [Candidatus Phascolarctobacterium caballi]